MWKAASAFVLIWVIGPCAAYGQQVGQRLIIEPPAGPIGSDQVAGPDDPLLVQMVRSEKHVKLQAPLQAKVRRLWSAEQVNLPAGAILHAASLDGAVFCSPIKADSGVCVEDTDQDGSFDVSYSAFTDDPMQWNYFAFHADGDFSLGFYRDPERLSSVIPYVEAEAGEVLRSSVKVVMSTNFKRKSPDRPVKIEPQIFTGTKKDRGPSAKAPSVTMDPHVGGSVSILNALFEIQGVEPDGSIHYRVIRPIPSTPGQFGVWPFRW
jgi:hypothetical protein